MNRRHTSLLAAALLAFGPAGAAVSRDGPPALPTAGVPAAEWHEPTLCAPTENVVWSCRAKKKTISVCASRKISASEGYIQYRIGKPGALEMRYPETLAHPRGRFRYTLYLQGNQSLEFTRGGFNYSIVEDLRSPEDGIIVTKNDADVARITCNGGGAIEIQRPDLLGIADTPYGN